VVGLLGLFILPFIASLAVLMCPIGSGCCLKRRAVIMSALPLALLAYGSNSWMGATIDSPWIPSLSIHFHLSMDTLSLLFLFLTALIIPISLLAIPSSGLASPRLFYSLILLLQGLLIGFFTARDLVVFTIFWEAMLLPLYFLINLWGGSGRQQASLKFLLYMIAGSILLIAALLSLYFTAQTATGTATFDLTSLAQVAKTSPYAPWLCAIFLLAFAVKTPLFPFHAWLPDAYCQAPTTGTILLAALLSKAGIYGLMRIAMPLFPSLMQQWSPFLLSLAIAGVLYGAFAAWWQSDYKRLIAYSSFSHINFVLAGLFVGEGTAYSGALLQALNHGITIAALFLVAGWLEERLGSTAMAAATGLAKYMPQLCWLTLLFVLSSVALPGLNNFVGEVMILFGLFDRNPLLVALIGLTVIFSVVYMLRWMQKVYFEVPTSAARSWIDIGGKHLAIAAPLALLIFWVGIYPAPLLELISDVGNR